MTLETLKELKSGVGSTLGDYKFLYGFISLIKPRRIVEIGTHYGLSAIAMALALRDEGLTKSRILSIDIACHVLEVAKKHLEQLGLQKYVQLVCGDSSIIGEYSRFDVAFIDGDHSYEGCLKDFNNVKDKATYILIHDAAILEGISRAVEEIRTREKYEVFNMNIGDKGEQWSYGKVVYRAYPGIAIIKVR